MLGAHFVKHCPGIRFVVSVRGRISDKAAIAYSRGFYLAYRTGLHVAACHSHGCATIKNALDPYCVVEDVGGVLHIFWNPNLPHPHDPGSEWWYDFSVDMYGEDFRTTARAKLYLSALLKREGAQERSAAPGRYCIPAHSSSERISMTNATIASSCPQLKF